MRRLSSILFISLVCGSSAFGAVQVHSLLVSGFQAPGAPAGVTFTGLRSTRINVHGDISFVGTLSNNRYGIWATQSANLNPIAIQGSAAPVTPSSNYLDIVHGGIADDGRVGFTAFLSMQRIGIFLGEAGGAQLVARTNGPAPGLGEGSYFTSPFSGPSGGSILAGPNVNATGNVAFYATAYDTAAYGERFGIWSDRGGTLNPIALTDMQAPGFPEGTFITSIGDSDTSFAPFMNDLGNVAFGAGVKNFQNGTTSGAVYAQNQENLSLVAKDGDSALGGGLSSTFGGLWEPDINNLGHVAFHAYVSGPSISAVNDYGIWSNAGGILHKVAQEGDPAPGTIPGVVFSSFDARALINGADQTLVRATLTGLGIDTNTNSGMWVERNGSLDLIFQEGMQAPGTASGVVFRDPSVGGFGFTMNGAGQVVFRHTLAGSGVTSANGEGIFAADSLGNLELVLRRGQTIEALPGMFKTILDFNFTEYNGGDDGSNTLNDLGQFSIPVRYTDGTQGILIATIPEPATAAAITCLFIAVIRGKRRTRVHPKA